MQSQITVNIELVETLKLCLAFLNAVNEAGEAVRCVRADNGLLLADYNNSGLMNGRPSESENALKRYKECDDECFCPRKAQRV